MRGILAIALSAFSVLAIGSAQARADTTVFENGIFFVTDPTVLDDVYIGVGAVVFLDGILVTGDIEVTDGAWLSASGILVEGKIEFDGAAIVDLEHSVVCGSVEITHTGGAPVFGLLPSISVFDNSIGGNLKVKKNNVNSISISDNKIGGNLELSRNVSNFSFYSNKLTHVKKSCKR
jgi:hypothetical protein